MASKMLETVQLDDFMVQFVGDEPYTPRRVRRLSHNYSDHPLLSLDSLSKLAERLYAKKTGQVKFLSKGTRLDSDFNTLTDSEDNRTIAEVFENIANPGSWIAIYAVQTEPEYRELVWDIVNSVQGDWKNLDPGVFFVDGYIFISSPPSVTPFHIDRENNFLLQIAGKKAFGVWNPDERKVVSEIAVEDWIINSSLKRVKYRPEYLQHAAVNGVLEAGQGIYMPSTSPHMTHAEENLATPDCPYSITIGVVFYTSETRRYAYIYTTNNLLRKLGLVPNPPGRNKLIDSMKIGIGRLVVFIKKSIRGYSPPTGFYKPE